jgi:hypothetical protein
MLNGEYGLPYSPKGLLTECGLYGLPYRPNGLLIESGSYLFVLNFPRYFPSGVTIAGACVA